MPEPAVPIDQVAREACRRLGPDWTMGRVIHQTRKTGIYRLEQTASGRRVALKQYRGDDHSAQSEFTLLKRLDEAHRNRNAPRVPRPVFVMPRRNAYCMDWVEGRQLLYFCRTSRDNRLQGLRVLGDWLARFHRLRVNGFKPYTAGLNPVLRAGAVRRDILSVCETAEPAVRARLMRALGPFEDVSRLARGAEVLHVLPPQDSNPKNFILHLGEMTGIDVQVGQPCPRLASLAAYLVRCWSAMPQMGKGCPCCSPDAWALFDGYGQPPPAGPVWKFEMIKAALRFHLAQLPDPGGRCYERSGLLVDVLTRDHA